MRPQRGGYGLKTERRKARGSEVGLGKEPTGTPQYLPSPPSSPPAHHQVQAAQTMAPSKAMLPPPHEVGSQRSPWRMGPSHFPTMSGYALSARRNSSVHTAQGLVSQAAMSVSAVRISHE